MKDRQCEIIIEPQGISIDAAYGDSLYTLLLVAGIVSAGDPLSNRLHLERGAVSSAANAEAESAVFSAAEIAEGWLLASERHVTGDAVFSLYSACSMAETPGGNQAHLPLATGLGMAFDLGAGTLAAGLVDLGTTRIPLLAARRNRQIDIAAEIGERIALCRRQEDALSRLNELLLADVASLTDKLLSKAGLGAEQVKAVTMAGNDTILRFLRKLPPDADLAAEAGKTAVLSAGELSLAHFLPDTPVYLLPGASRDIGADTVASALAAGLLHKKEQEKITLLVDIGMNGEIIGAGCGRLLAATVSTAPFEGVGISCGMQATTGAITRVFIDDIVTLRTVRDGRPLGISGAGLISVAYALLSRGMLDAEGHMLQPEGLPEQIAARFRGTAAGREFLISPADKFFPRDICVNQEDILQLQLAKGAVYAACRAVLAALDAEDKDIGEIILSEAYRANLSPRAVSALGLLPRIGNERLTSIGNASWQGAYLALSNRQYLAETEQVARAIERLDLTSDMVYAEHFIKGMNFPGGNG